MSRSRNSYTVIPLAGVLLLSACASGGSTLNGVPPGAGTPPPLNNILPSPPPTPGNPVWISFNPSQVPTFDIGAPHATFPFAATTMDYTATSISAPKPAQDGTARIMPSLADPALIKLVVPSIGLDTTIAGRFSSMGDGRIARLSYVSFGWWHRDSFALTGSATTFVFGPETQIGAMPGTGTATYSGSSTVHALVFFPDDGTFLANGSGRTVPGLDITGDAAFTVDFASGNMDGIFSNMRGDVENIGFDRPWNDVGVHATIAAGSNRFSGSTVAMPAPFSSPASMKGPASGSIDGAFYGPNAQNLGATWTLTDGTRTAVGVVGAGRQ